MDDERRGSKMVKCRRCEGEGYITEIFGNHEQHRGCPRCHGTGREPAKKNPAPTGREDMTKWGKRSQVIKVLNATVAKWRRAVKGKADGNDQCPACKEWWKDVNHRDRQICPLQKGRGRIGETCCGGVWGQWRHGMASELDVLNYIIKVRNRIKGGKK